MMGSWGPSGDGPLLPQPWSQLSGAWAQHRNLPRVVPVYLPAPYAGKGTLGVLLG